MSKSHDEGEPRLLLDFDIEPGAVCGVCGEQGSQSRPLCWCCSECGKPMHFECGADTEPSGGWDRDDNENYWVCNHCLSK